ncbi:endonuclease/exonuclease/phosphatase family protein [Hyphobacterium sp. CCMP332]|uniref:endonuclease/exonuclease/phosphatase family protein n=1 Tax=Hyphobacterium sp. CCMP332 TaxID=2749086 RepID=UPI00164FD8E7|nr:endonuclease/exonuclease/phosphatase family protein [Hyphobacterium sp. CCMP332]QNL18632.1 endonuclease/exonuclease/phosphatase family protein [Hyphobacterium sp. CCMP332]
MTSNLSLLNWNIERHGPQTWQAKSLLSEIVEIKPNIVCLTEAHDASASDLGGHSVGVVGQNWSPTSHSERKVLLWSRREWSDVDMHDDLNEIGAAITATTSTEFGKVRVMGLCIPYHRATPFGSAERVRNWVQHGLFLGALYECLTGSAENRPDIIVGDFNRKLPSAWGSKSLLEKLEETFSDYTIVTRGKLPPLDRKTVCHVAVKAGLECQAISLLDANDASGRARSDHNGVLVELGQPN